MFRTYARFLTPLLLLVLAGCFRSAGDGMQPTTSVDELRSTVETMAAPAENADELAETPASTDDDTSDTDDFEVAITAEVLERGGITEVDDDPAADNDTVDGDDTGDSTLPPITVSSPTRVAPTTPPEEAEATDDSDQFIQPSVPLGPITPDFATPPGAVEAEGSNALEGLQVIEPDDSLEAEASSLNDADDGDDEPDLVVTPTDLIDTECTHIVQAGDTLFRIALDNNVTLADVRAANPDLVGNDPILQLGQIINLPDCGDDTSSVAAEDDGSTLSATAVPAPTQSVVEGTGIEDIHVVQAGDTLFFIAQQYGVSVNAIVQANDLPNPNALSVGQELIIPPPQ